MKTVARAIILNEKHEVLLGKRVRNNGEGQWALVGGKPDEGEAPEQAVVREVMEEIGVVFHPVFFKDMVTHLSVEDGEWQVFVFYGSVTGTPVLKPDEVSDLRYFGRDEIRTMKLAFGHNGIIEDFFSRVSL